MARRGIGKEVDNFVKTFMQMWKMVQRDREIEHFGDRVGQSFLTIGGIAALILAMVDAAHFWIGVTLFTGFFLSAFVGGLARLGAYRAGFQ